MKSFTTVVAFCSLASTVAAHGFVTSPPARMAGSAMAAACGQQVFNNQAADNYGNIQGELQVASSQSDFNAAACNIWLCKGFKLEDNAANVQSFTAGQVVPITVDIRAPHTGSANVSIVDTATNTVIGSALKSWDVYASNASPIPADQENFSITIPTDLGDGCATAGACVIQWWWDARSIDQSYEACIDFTVAGSGSAPASSSIIESSPSTSVAAITISTAVAASTPDSLSESSTSAVATTASVGVSSNADTDIEAPTTLATSTAIPPATAVLTSGIIPTEASTTAAGATTAAPILVTKTTSFRGTRHTITCVSHE